MEWIAHSRNTPTLAGPESSGVMLKPGLGRQRDLPEFVCGGEQEGEWKRIVCVCQSVRGCVCVHACE